MTRRQLLAEEKNRMVSEHLMARGITDRSVIDAFIEVPREIFVPPELAPLSYQDAPLPIDRLQTISQPYVVALMCQLLQLKKNFCVLDIGTGSGFQAAILSRIVKRVVTIERLVHLAAAAQDRFRCLGYRNIDVIVADGSLGYASKAPYDAIKSAAAADRIPAAWIKQLRTGGRLVTPINSTFSQKLVRLIKLSSGLVEEDWGPVKFVPLIKEPSSSY